jgi:hypothetical protein
MLGTCLVAGYALSALGAQSSAAPATPAQTAAAARSSNLQGVVPKSERAEKWYAHVFGVDQMRVTYTASGSSLEFRWRVVDPAKASILTDKRLTPFMVDQRSGARLEVPTMEKIGALRQQADPEVGREYWMLFANRGKIVQRGNRVDVEIGSFRVRGLVVQ